jgi:hypothetical protein
VRFDRLTERAQNHLTIVIKAILSLPPAKQNLVFGRAYQIERDDMEKKIEEMFAMLDETEYEYPINANLKIFLHLLEEQWADCSV